MNYRRQIPQITTEQSELLLDDLRHSNDIVTEEYQIFDPFTRVELEYLTLGGILKTKQFYLLWMLTYTQSVFFTLWFTYASHEVRDAVDNNAKVD